MGPGGYAQTPIEEVSPVSFDLKQERRRASLAEVIAIDYSGSMAMSAGKNTKLELANEAAARSAELLGTGDRLGRDARRHRGQLDRAARAGRRQGGDRKADPRASDRAAAASTSTSRSTPPTPRSAARTVNLKHLLLFADGADAEETAARLRAGERGQGARHHHQRGFARHAAATPRRSST